MSLDLDLLRQHVANGVVREVKHPTLPLSLFNYSVACQYEKLWDDVSLQCRGLVMEGDRVVARPFRKFFNDTEHAEGDIPWHRPCEITEKMDGSLLIVFHYAGEWHACTRGSFTSQQSVRGLQILRDKYGFEGLSTVHTYLFEVIYPENRIVCDYGDCEDVVLLGIMDTEPGWECNLCFAPSHLNVVKRLPPTANPRELRQLIRDCDEGYVVRFDNGFRVKVKGERYLELHRLISGLSSRSVWENLSQQKPFDDLLATIPDEFGDWVKQERADQLAAFDGLSLKVSRALAAVRREPDRKSKALRITSEFRDVASATFAALDGKPYEHILWKQLYPEFRRPEVAQRIEA